jgi:hypothetical protein
MTILDLAERDYKRAKINYLRGKERKGIDPEELKHLEELMTLRGKILRVVEEGKK